MGEEREVAAVSIEMSEEIKGGDARHPMTLCE
jgi:hypothetical protein